MLWKGERKMGVKLLEKIYGVCRKKIIVYGSSEELVLKAIVNRVSSYWKRYMVFCG